MTWGDCLFGFGVDFSIWKGWGGSQESAFFTSAIDNYEVAGPWRTLSETLL